MLADPMLWHIINSPRFNLFLYSQFSVQRFSWILFYPSIKQSAWFLIWFPLMSPWFDEQISNDRNMYRTLESKKIDLLSKSKGILWIIEENFVAWICWVKNWNVCNMRAHTVITFVETSIRTLHVNKILGWSYCFPVVIFQKV